MQTHSSSSAMHLSKKWKLFHFTTLILLKWKLLSVIVITSDSLLDVTLKMTIIGNEIFHIIMSELLLTFIFETLWMGNKYILPV